MVKSTRSKQIAKISFLIMAPIFLTGLLTFNALAESVPTIASVSPSSAKIGDTITITGTGFASAGNNVNFGLSTDTPMETGGEWYPKRYVADLTSPDGKTITFTLPFIVYYLEGPFPYTTQDDDLKSGTYYISVFNTNGKSQEKIFFTVSKMGHPVIASISPESASAGMIVAINGSGFTRFGNKIFVDYVGACGATCISKYIKYEVPSFDGISIVFNLPNSIYQLTSPLVGEPTETSVALTAGSHTFTVVNDYGAISNAVSFTVLPAAVPTILNISPSTAKIGDTVTINGSGFTQNTAPLPAPGSPGIGTNLVYFVDSFGVSLGATGGVTYVNSTTLSLVIPSGISGGCTPPPYSYCWAGSEFRPGDYAIFVKNDNGTSNTAVLTIVDYPSIRSISPSTAKIGDTVTINGSGFTPDTPGAPGSPGIGTNWVNFINSSGQTLGSVSVTYINSTTLSLVIPAGVGGACTNSIPGSCTPYNALQPGTYTISVTNINGTGKSRVTLTLVGSSFECFSDGTLVKILNDPAIYIIKNCQKWLIPDVSVFDASGYQWPSIQTVTDGDLNRYQNYILSLIRTIDDPDVYRVIDNKKFWIPSAEAFNSAGYNWSDVTVVPTAQRDSYPEIYLIKSADSDKVYVLGKGLIRHIPNASVFESYGYKWGDIVTVNPTELDMFDKNNLIRGVGDSKVYVLENGVKRWITTPQAFNNAGYDWNKIMEVNSTELNSYASGSEIE